MFHLLYSYIAISRKKMSLKIQFRPRNGFFTAQPLKKKKNHANELWSVVVTEWRRCSYSRRIRKKLWFWQLIAQKRTQTSLAWCEETVLHLGKIRSAKPWKRPMWNKHSMGSVHRCALTCPSHVHISFVTLSVYFLICLATVLSKLVII